MNSSSKRYNVDGTATRKTSFSSKMDSLKNAADMVKKSPRMMKKKIGNALNKNKPMEDWIHNRENVKNGVTFNVKVLGRERVTDGQGQNTEKIVQIMVQRHQKKSKAEKLQKVAIYVDSKKLLIRDLTTRDLENDVPVYRISYCTADPKYPKVFSFVARERASKQLFAHVFLTNKRAMAEAMALTVAQAFTMSYEEWEEKSNQRKSQVDKIQEKESKDLYEGLGKENSIKSNSLASYKEGGDDFGYVAESLAPKVQEIVIHDDPSPEDSPEEDDDFSSFAQSRSKTLNTGLVRRATFKGNVTDYLAVNNTAADLDRAASFDDLFREGNSPPTNNPFISDQSYNTSNNPFSTDQSNKSKLDHSNQSNSNPFQQSTLNPFSSGTDSTDIIMPTIVAPQSSANESNSGNLIDF